MFPFGGGYGGYCGFGDYYDDYEDDYVDSFMGGTMRDRDRGSRFGSDLGGWNRGPLEEAIRDPFDDFLGSSRQRRRDPYDADDELFSDMFSRGASRDYRDSVDDTLRDAYRERSDRHNRRDSGRDRTRQYFDFMEDFGRMNLGEDFLRERAQPRRDRPRDRGVRFAEQDDYYPADEEFFMSGALPNPDRPQSPRIIRDPDEYFGIPLGGGSERRSGGGSRRSARRDEGSQGDGEWIDYYNDYGRPHTYARINEYRSHPFGAAYHGLWEGGRRQRERQRESNDPFSRRRRRPY